MCTDSTHARTASSPSITTAWRTVLTRCANSVTNISYQLDGGAPVSVCNGCGENPSFSFSFTLAPGTHNLAVTARDNQGGTASVSGAIQVELPPPTLSIARTAVNTVLVSWPSSASGFSLQQTSDLASGNWTPVLEPVSDNGSTKSVVVNTSAGMRLYRLIKSAP